MCYVYVYVYVFVYVCVYVYVYAFIHIYIYAYIDTSFTGRLWCIVPPPRTMERDGFGLQPR